MMMMVVMVPMTPAITVMVVMMMADFDLDLRRFHFTCGTRRVVGDELGHGVRHRV
jgi:hypothetical protein